LTTPADIVAEPCQAFTISYTCGTGPWQVLLNVDGTPACNMLQPAGPSTFVCRGYEQGVTRLPFEFAEQAIVGAW
jgi:hypothetical protein